MSKIEGDKILIYVGDTPIGVTEGATFNATPKEDLPILCPARSEFVMTLEGHYQFGSDDKFKEMTYMQKIRYNWYRSSELPRKEKKAYRKRLSKAYGQELYRQQVMNYLNKI